MYKGNAFSILFRFLLALGYPYPSDSLKAKSEEQDVLSTGIKVWCAVAILIKTALLYACFNFMGLIFPTTSVVYTLFGFNICVYINMWILCTKRGSICESVRKILELSKIIDPGPFIGRKYINIQMILTVLSVVAVVIIFILFFFVLKFDIIKQSFAVVFADKVADPEMLAGVAIFFVIFMHNVSLMTSFVTLFLCDNAFHSLHDLMRQYGVNLKNELARGDYTQQTVMRYVSLFKQIYVCVKDMDTSLNSIVFFLYGATISNFFSTVSILLSNSEMYQNDYSMAYVSFTSITSLAMSIFLTLTAAKVSDSGKSLVHTVVVCSENITEFSPDLKTMAAFSLLVQNVKTPKIVATGWGMFSIYKGFLLNIAGVMVTYGVLMYQLDALAE